MSSGESVRISVYLIIAILFIVIVYSDMSFVRLFNLCYDSLLRSCKFSNLSTYFFKNLGSVTENTTGPIIISHYILDANYVYYYIDTINYNGTIYQGLKVYTDGGPNAIWHYRITPTTSVMILRLSCYYYSSYFLYCEDDNYASSRSFVLSAGSNTIDLAFYVKNTSIRDFLLIDNSTHIKVYNLSNNYYIGSLQKNGDNFTVTTQNGTVWGGIVTIFFIADNRTTSCVNNSNLMFTYGDVVYYNNKTGFDYSLITRNSSTWTNTNSNGLCKALIVHSNRLLTPDIVYTPTANQNEHLLVSDLSGYNPTTLESNVVNLKNSFVYDYELNQWFLVPYINCTGMTSQTFSVAAYAITNPSSCEVLESATGIGSANYYSLFKSLVNVSCQANTSLVICNYDDKSQLGERYIMQVVRLGAGLEYSYCKNSSTSSPGSLTCGYDDSAFHVVSFSVVKNGITYEIVKLSLPQTSSTGFSPFGDWVFIILVFVVSVFVLSTIMQPEISVMTVWGVVFLFALFKIINFSFLLVTGLLVTSLLMLFILRRF